MALFKSNQKSVNTPQPQSNPQNVNTTKVIEPTTKTTFVAQGLEVTGNLKGTGSVQIEGTLHGDIFVNSIVIGESGVVHGNIHAKYIIINGKLNGSITCDSLEIMRNGDVLNTINVKKITISGNVQGSIMAEDEINIAQEGNVKATQITSKQITVNGSFIGKLTASELLEIGTNGSVEGEIMVKNIKTHEGGKLIGSMRPYQEEKRPLELEKETPKETSKEKTPKASK